jgi:hypothetical protein
MSKLLIIINPYNKKIVIPIEKSFCEKIFKILDKNKSNFKRSSLKIPEIGFRGFVLKYNKTTNIFIYEKDVILTNCNVSTLFIDEKKTLYNLIVRELLKKHNNEILYFLDVKNKNQ